MSIVKEEKQCAPDDAAVGQKEACSNMFEGEIVSVTGNNLVTKCSKGNEHSYQLEPDAELNCDGTDCQVEDLKIGSKVRVTTKQDDQKVATCVECLDQHDGFGG